MLAWHPEVVIVDDDPDILDIVSDVLRDEGFTPVVFRDGAHAEAHIVHHPPGLVLTDLRLPVLSGRDLVSHLRQRVGDRLPIIVMSGLADDAESEHLPVQGYLRKPFELDDLCALVNRWTTPPQPV
jgi:DNA-binding response OmpR family regulator